MGADLVGSIVLAAGFLAVLAGLGLMFYSVDDQERNDQGWFWGSDPERTDDNVRRYQAGNFLAIGGGIAMAVGGVLMAMRR